MSLADDLSVFVPPEREGLTFIEQLTARAIETCKNAKAPILLGVHNRLKQAVFLRAACGQWSCPTCAARNAKRWIARLINGMNDEGTGGMWYFVTITAHKNWRGQDNSLKNLRANWQKLRKRMARAHDGELYYAMVYEPHSDGTFHMHVLTNAKLDTRWYKDASAKCGMGYQCDCSPMKNAGQVAGYVSKYMLKGAEVADRYPVGMRRVNVSRNWPLLPDLTSDDSEYTYHHVPDEVAGRFEKQSLQRQGYNVSDPKNLFPF